MDNASRPIQVTDDLLMAIRKKLERYSSSGNTSKVAEYVKKLSNLHPTFSDLKKTGLIDVLERTTSSCEEATSLIAQVFEPRVSVDDSPASSTIAAATSSTVVSVGDKDVSPKFKLSFKDYMKRQGRSNNNNNNSKTVSGNALSNGMHEMPDGKNVAMKRPLTHSFDPLDISLIDTLLDVDGVDRDLSHDKSEQSPFVSVDRKKTCDGIVDRDSFFHCKKQKSVMYHGRQVTNFNLSSLLDLCIECLKDNVSKINHVGNIPFHIMSPVLECATAEELEVIHVHNPQYAEEMDLLWKRFCERKFKGCMTDDMESWHDLYLRKNGEEEDRFESLRMKVSHKYFNKPEGRSMKLTSITKSAGGKRSTSIHHSAIIADPSSTSKVQQPAAPISKTAGTQAKRNTMATGAISIDGDRAKMNSAPQSKQPNRKPKMAPLMAKTIKMFKSRRK